MTKIVHDTTKVFAAVKFETLEIGEVFRVCSPPDACQDLLMKLQPPAPDMYALRNAFKFHRYHRDYDFDFNGYGGPRPAPYNAVYITGKQNVGFLVDFRWDRLVIPTKKCKLETEF